MLKAHGKLTVFQIAQKVLELGYKTKATKFVNTIRVQLYRLADSEMIRQNHDKTFEII